MATDNDELHAAVDDKLKAHDNGLHPLPPEPPRDQWGRYEFGGNGITRVSTYASMAKDMSGLTTWKVKLGMEHAVEHADAITEGGMPKPGEALRLAGASDKAALGTAWHRIMWHVLNESAGRIPKSMTLPMPSGRKGKIDKIDERLTVIRDTLSEYGFTLDPARSELIVSDRDYCGTTDGQLITGEHYDWKSGARIYEGHDYAVALALYANAVTERYHVEGSGWKSRPRQGTLDKKVGYIFHTPVDGTPRMAVYKVDLERGWRAFTDILRPLRDYRQRGVMRRMNPEDAIPIEVGPGTILEAYNALVQGGHRQLVIDNWPEGLPGPRQSAGTDITASQIMAMHDALATVERLAAGHDELEKLDRRP